jgi:hypothetical protein
MISINHQFSRSRYTYVTAESISSTVLDFVNPENARRNTIVDSITTAKRAHLAPIVLQISTGMSNISVIMEKSSAFASLGTKEPE